MWFPTDNDLRIFMRKIVRVNEENERDNLRDDVVRMRDLLSLLLVAYIIHIMGWVVNRKLINGLIAASSGAFVC